MASGPSPMDSLYGNLLGSEVPAKKEADDIFAEPKAQAAPVEKNEKKEPEKEKPSPALPQTFSAAKLMMPPVRKKVEPVKKPSMPALDLSKLAAEKEALMKQRAAAETSKAAQAPASSARPESDGSAQNSLGKAALNEPIAANLFGDPNEEYDPAKPNDYDEFCRRRMRQKAEEEMEKRRQEALARQAKPAAAQPKEEDFATKMMKKMGWQEGAGLGKEGQGMANPLVMQKTDQKAGRIVEGSKREAPSPPQGQPEPKQAKASAPKLPPTRVLLLNNLVGAGDVDEDLEEETAEEAGKYGKLKRCVIKELAGKPDDEAVRIFLEYEDVSAATKAFADMNGRYFGGRVVRARFYEEGLFAQGQLEVG
ncbi:unnamed protein product [Effrenium voratum]|uniref:Splicing factor 45 n=1 Tax=Effrenium voratum TaxID=2562239 RepID=A0AA36J1R5_9DINO|nr:unnamed protein product [Effrenium voratum]CAJ1396928.1 unnamed protein product [Effrenium voratum]CAJ1456108.1 unnamed protein product [Effrenium voratum]